MPDASFWLLLLIIFFAVGFGIVNGFNDAANAISASVGSRSLSPRQAIVIAAVSNLIGAVTGLAVAKTIGKGILTPEATSYLTVLSALASVIIWGSVATYLGLPVSITHSFVAGLASAGVAVVGGGAVVWGVLGRVLMAVAVAPLLGFIGGFVIMMILYWIFQRSPPTRMRVLFSRLQWITTAFLAYSHGKNDGQMPIGVITMALVIYSGQSSLWDQIPLWVVVLSALSISFGTAVGGWRVVRTLGWRVTALQPVHGFAADFSAAAVIEAASLLGIPVSTTHCASGAIMGVGATRRLSAVRWGVVGNIVAAWILTFPICAGLGYTFAWLFKLVF